jgi:hypothetical protein
MKSLRKPAKKNKCPNCGGLKSRRAFECKSCKNSMASILGRFWSHVDKTTGHGPNGECWIWIGATDSKGYGSTHIRKKTTSAHRASYIHTFGSIPDGMQLCHRCDTPLCVNPSHLFPGTQQDNINDMMKKGRHGGKTKTHCPSGHPYDEINTRWYQGRRYCRECLHISNRRAA